MRRLSVVFEAGVKNEFLEKFFEIFRKILTNSN